jgi:hypothetical protein
MAASFIWLAAVLPFLALHHGGVKPFFTPGAGFPDFPQYYIGGSLALAGDFASLYAQPGDGATGNIGDPSVSIPKPGYTRLAQEKGVEDNMRYNLPPPSAFLFTPLALFPYPAARWIWIGLLGLLIWIDCLLAARAAETCGAGANTVSLWWFVMAFSPLVTNVIRIGNSTPFLTAALALAAAGIYQKKTTVSVASCILAGLLKGTSIVFAPLLLALKRWKIILTGAAASLLICAASLAITGVDVFREFITVVLPSTRIVITNEFNCSLYACLYRMFGDAALHGPLASGVRLTGAGLGLLLCLLIWKRRDRLGRDFGLFNAAVTGLIGLYIIFSPYTWLHYALCLFPFLPALWTSLEKTAPRILLAVSFAGIWLPPGLRICKRLGTLPEPLASHLLLGEIGITALAFYLLIRPQKTGHLNIGSTKTGGCM